MIQQWMMGFTAASGWAAASNWLLTSLVSYYSCDSDWTFPDAHEIMIEL